ncbi:MAG: tRNA (adenosine(37)-N6)-threonylcarbamoyltransferase complex dimerization subunit type 1 TsaB [Chloroflexota bacterium]
MLVVLDTSTRLAGVALYDERGLLAETNWVAGSNHTVQLLPTLDRLLSLHGAEARSLRAVGVALGPGSFNGLRVALSTAKGLCLGLGIPLVGVGTLPATAHGHQLAGKQVCALVDAGRGQLHGALFPPEMKAWTAEGASGIRTLAELLALVDRPTLFCGDLHEQAVAAIAGQLGGLAAVASPGTAPRRAAWLAELAWRRFSAGESDDLAATQPLYLRRPDGQPTG